MHIPGSLNDIFHCEIWIYRQPPEATMGELRMKDKLRTIITKMKKKINQRPPK